jgi:hypothetical protein
MAARSAHRLRADRDRALLDGIHLVRTGIKPGVQGLLGPEEGDMPHLLREQARDPGVPPL